MCPSKEIQFQSPTCVWNNFNYQNFTVSFQKKQWQIFYVAGGYEQKSIWLNFTNEIDSKYVVKYDQTFGKCFSVELDPKVTEIGVTKMEFFAKLNIYIYLHHPGQYMDVDSKSKV